VSRNAATALVGISYMVLAGACFAVLDTSAKVVAASVPIVMAAAIRYLLQAALSTVVLAPVHGRALLRVRHPWLQAVRGSLLAASTILAMLGLQIMPVGEFTAIVMITPMVVTVLAVSVLKERVSMLHWLFVAGGFAGALLIVRPGGQEGLGWGALYGLGCMACSSAFQLLSNHLGPREHPATTHLCSTWIGAAAGALALPFVWATVDSSLLWTLMVLMGIMGAGGHFVLAQAHQKAPASILMPYMYAHIGFAVLAGWVVFGHVPQPLAIAGIGLIVGCGVASAWWSARQRQAAGSMPAT